MNALLASTTQEFGISWPLLVFQLLNISALVALFVMAARAILKRGQGWEVPVWLLLSFCIPIVFPILALIHFRKSKFLVNPAL